MAKKVLIADDSGAMLKIGEACLKKLGVTVITANDGQEAIDKANAETPDIVLLDAEMPVVDGWEACTQIKKLIPSVHIFMCTGHDLSDQKDQLTAAGADGFIAKPYNPSVFCQILTPLLS